MNDHLQLIRTLVVILKVLFQTSFLENYPLGLEQRLETHACSPFTQDCRYLFVIQSCVLAFFEITIRQLIIQ